MSQYKYRHLTPLLRLVGGRGKARTTFLGLRNPSPPKSGTKIASLASPLGARSFSTQNQQEAFLREYKIRSSLERHIYYYAQKPLSKFSIQKLYDQSEKLSPTFILQNAQETVEFLLAYNARRLKEFRNLPYLVVLNPSIAESYNSYLKTMSSLIMASLHPPITLQDNYDFVENVLGEFLDTHLDTLLGLSKGFNEVIHLISPQEIKCFLDAHLKERISMRLIAHQHIQLSNGLKEDNYVKGGKYNGVIRELDIYNMIKKNAELVNDLCLMKYDQSVEVQIDNNLYVNNYWSRLEPDLTPPPEQPDQLIFPYIDYHLDYMLTELFKNSFRAHIENNVSDPIQVTVSVSHSPLYLEIRIRDKGKGIDQQNLKHMFDYSFTTFQSNEGEAYKTLNQPPGASNTVAGMGYGLPLLKNYIEIFNDTIPKSLEDEEGSGVNGLLTVQTYQGWGTDVYIKTVGS